MTRSRQSRGNMIFLLSLTIGLIVAVAVGMLIFNRVLLERTRAQYSLDALALSLASKINPGDRVGQINRLEAASRELVFTSRQAVNATSSQELSGFARLSNMLLDEAREGQALVERERRNQIAIIRQEVLADVHKIEARRSLDSDRGFLSIQTKVPEIVRVELGRIKDVDSNIQSLDAIPDLCQFDRSSGYVHNASKLYRCDLMAKLPSPDADLEYRFCSLPAFVGNTCSPPRNTNPEAFKSFGSIFANGVDTHEAVDEIPDALQISSNMQVDMANAFDSQKKLATITALATGVSSGASSDSE